MLCVAETVTFEVCFSYPSEVVHTEWSRPVFEDLHQNPLYVVSLHFSKGLNQRLEEFAIGLLSCFPLNSGAASPVLIEN